MLSTLMNICSIRRLRLAVINKNSHFDATINSSGVEIRIFPETFISIMSDNAWVPFIASNHRPEIKF